MKRAGVILLILLMIYNLSFSFCYNSLVEETVLTAAKGNGEMMFFDISDDSLIQPFLMDSEFSNHNANRGYIEINVNPIKGIKFVNLLSINSVLLTTTITPVQIESILTASKYFIPSFRMSNLLGNHFAFRI